MFIQLKTFKIVNLLQNYLLLSTQKISEVNINVILLMQKEIRIDKSSDLLKAMQERKVGTEIIVLLAVFSKHLEYLW